MNKLQLINSMEVIDSGGNGGELEFVYVVNNPPNREILLKLGVKQIDIDDMTSTDGDTIDISGFGFTNAEAKWFESDMGGFLSFVPDHAPEWAK